MLSERWEKKVPWPVKDPAPNALQHINLCSEPLLTAPLGWEANEERHRTVDLEIKDH